MTITVLIENHADREGRKLASEHGLSLLVDVGAATFLFDTGSWDRFLENARRLGRFIEVIARAAAPVAVGMLALLALFRELGLRHGLASIGMMLTSVTVVGSLTNLGLSHFLP